MKKIILLYLLLSALFGCKKKDNSNVIEQEIPLELNNIEWTCFSEYSNKVIYTVQFTTDSTGEMWDDMFDNKKFSWKAEKFDKGKYFIYFKYSNNSDTSLKTGTCTFTNATKDVTMLGYVCKPSK